MESKLHHGYVITEEGLVLVQDPDVSDPHGFYLTDGEQSWSGGFGVTKWTAIAADDPRVTDQDRDEMDWALPADDTQEA